MSEVLDRLLFHWVPSKALIIGGRALSWDARCAGIYIGFALALLVQLLVARRARSLPAPMLLLAVGAISSLPMFLDLYTIESGMRAASNDVRYLTGLLFGSGFCLFLYPACVVVAGGAAARDAGIDPPGKIALIYLGVAAGFTARFVDTLTAFYVLEGLAWIGMGAVGLAMAIGALGGISGLLSRGSRPGPPRSPAVNSSAGSPASR